MVAWRAAGNLGACLCGARLCDAFRGCDAQQDATWLRNPATSDFNTGSNWSGGVVPGGTATFNASSLRNIDFSQSTTLGGISLTASAGNYSFNLGGSGRTVVISGIGLNAADGASMTFFLLGSVLQAGFIVF